MRLHAEKIYPLQLNILQLEVTTDNRLRSLEMLAHISPYAFLVGTAYGVTTRGQSSLVEV